MSSSDGPSSDDLKPRGTRRIIYVSDPSSVAWRYLPDPVREEDLTAWIDAIAAAEIDTFVQEVYSQGWSTYWRGDRLEYDARPQHRRFLPLLDAGVQPVEVLLDRCHHHGIEFFAGFRVNDNHGAVSIAQGVGAGAGFIVDNPQFQIAQCPDEGYHYRESAPLDFTHEEVRDFIVSAVEEVVGRFAVDGIELCYRDQRYFPPDTGAERRDLMTSMVGQIRAVLNQPSPRTGKPRIFGAHVFSSLEECRDMGLDVEKWIGEATVDYLAPADIMHADFSVAYEEFTALTRSTDCMLYPSIFPWTSVGARRRLKQEPISSDNRRALAQNIYGAGADGISLYNHFEYMHGGLDWGNAHPPFYPFALFDACELRPERVLSGRRHYIFDATWGGSMGFGPDRTSTGAVKAQRVILERTSLPSSGSYRFVVREHLNEAKAAMLLFRGFHMTLNDQLRVAVNGTPVDPADLRIRDNEVRVDFRQPLDEEQVERQMQEGHSREQAESYQPAPDPPFVTAWFALGAPPAVYGWNELELELVAADPDADGEIIIEEVEVFVIPRTTSRLPA